mmetsp:Transcript_4100/g.7582  ORF Transcript_4100/g.7582 Transcript_4100/m.7582 type:complete len:394 (+) Transcript_4100:143-1324(+)
MRLGLSKDTYSRKVWKNLGLRLRLPLAAFQGRNSSRRRRGNGNACRGGASGFVVGLCALLLFGLLLMVAVRVGFGGIWGEECSAISSQRLDDASASAESSFNFELEEEPEIPTAYPSSLAPITADIPTIATPNFVEGVAGEEEGERGREMVNALCFVVRFDKSMAEQSVTFLNSLYSWKTDLNISVTYIVTDKDPNSAASSQASLERARHAVKHYYYKQWPWHPRISISDLRYWDSVVQKHLKTCSLNEEDWGYAMTDLTLDAVLSDTGASCDCRNLIVTNGDNFYSRYFLNAVRPFLGETDLIGFDFISHHVWEGGKRNIYKQFDWTWGQVDLGTVIARASVYRALGSRKFCYAGMEAKDMRCADWALFSRIERLTPSIETKKIHQVLMIHQ